MTVGSSLLPRHPVAGTPDCRTRDTTSVQMVLGAGVLGSGATHAACTKNYIFKSAPSRVRHHRSLLLHEISRSVRLGTPVSRIERERQIQKPSEGADSERASERTDSRGGELRRAPGQISGQGRTHAQDTADSAPGQRSRTDPRTDSGQLPGHDGLRADSGRTHVGLRGRFVR